MSDNVVVRFRHHFLVNGAVFTVCTSLNHDTGEVTIGWASFNPEDNNWIRKVGASLARERLNTAPLKFVIFPDEPKICDYISLRALLTILGSVKTRGRVDNYPSTIPSDTLNAIQLEIICLLDLVGQRTGLKRLL